MEIFEHLPSTEKNAFLSSLPVISKNLEFFVIRFYFHFLRTKAGLLFQHINIEQQYKMFSSSLNIIITHISDPEQLEGHLYELIETHNDYGVIVEHVDYFIDSFMKALAEIFSNDSDREIIDVWSLAISEIMQYFKNNL